MQILEGLGKSRTLFSRLQGAGGFCGFQRLSWVGPILYISAVLPLWSAFAEKVRILTFCPKLVRKRFAFTQQSLLFTFPLQIA